MYRGDRFSFSMASAARPMPGGPPVMVIGTAPAGLAAAHPAAGGRSSWSWRRGNRSAPRSPSGRHVRLFSPWSYNIDPVARMLRDVGQIPEVDPSTDQFPVLPGDHG